MEKPAAIEKVKLLMRLAASAPENESANAKRMADNLIEKFGLTLEEYEEKEVKPVYTDDELLFATQDVSEWAAILALTVANKYDCFVIQEENVSSLGDKEFKYFVYGNDADVICCKMLFAFVKDEIDKAVEKNCKGRGQLYITSYCEGLVNGIRINIETEDFAVEGMVVQKEAEECPKEAMVKTEEKKDKEDIPIKEKVQLNKKEKPLDIIAYFTGEGHGRKIHIGKVLNDLYLTANGLEEEEITEEQDVDVQDYSWLNSLKDLFK